MVKLFRLQVAGSILAIFNIAAAHLGYDLLLKRVASISAVSTSSAVTSIASPASTFEPYEGTDVFLSTVFQGIIDGALTGTRKGTPTERANEEIIMSLLKLGPIFDSLSYIVAFIYPDVTYNVLDRRDNSVELDPDAFLSLYDLVTPSISNFIKSEDHTNFLKYVSSAACDFDLQAAAAGIQSQLSGTILTTKERLKTLEKYPQCSSKLTNLYGQFSGILTDVVSAIKNCSTSSTSIQHPTSSSNATSATATSSMPTSTFISIAQSLSSSESYSLTGGISSSSSNHSIVTSTITTLSTSSGSSFSGLSSSGAFPAGSPIANSSLITKSGKSITGSYSSSASVVYNSSSSHGSGSSPITSAPASSFSEPSSTSFDLFASSANSSLSGSFSNTGTVGTLSLNTTTVITSLSLSPIGATESGRSTSTALTPSQTTSEFSDSVGSSKGTSLSSASVTSTSLMPLQASTSTLSPIPTTSSALFYVSTTGMPISPPSKVSSGIWTLTTAHVGATSIGFVTLCTKCDESAFTTFTVLTKSLSDSTIYVTEPCEITYTSASVSTIYHGGSALTTYAPCPSCTAGAVTSSESSVTAKEEHTETMQEYTEATLTLPAGSTSTNLSVEVPLVVVTDAHTIASAPMVVSSLPSEVASTTTIVMSTAEPIETYSPLIASLVTSPVDKTASVPSDKLVTDSTNGHSESSSTPKLNSWTTQTSISPPEDFISISTSSVATQVSAPTSEAAAESSNSSLFLTSSGIEIPKTSIYIPQPDISSTHTTIAQATPLVISCESDICVSTLTSVAQVNGASLTTQSWRALLGGIAIVVFIF